MEEISYWTIFINFLNNNQGLIIFFELVITAGIFFGILIITMRYARSTKEIADKTAESVRASKEFLDATVKLRKDELTFELIKQWYDVKKEIGFEEERLSRELDRGDKGMHLKIVNCCVLPLEYFNIVDEAIESSSINDKLYIKNMSSELRYFNDVRLPVLQQKYKNSKRRLINYCNLEEGEFASFSDVGFKKIFDKVNKLK